MIDIFEEKRLADMWSFDTSEKNVDLDALVELCVNGLKTCEGQCLSRDTVGADRCKCIRERFDCLESYELYQVGRKMVQQYVAATGLSILIGEIANED